MVWNYNDDDVTSPPSPVELDITGISNNNVLLHHYRVDQRYSNSFEVWKAMGKPQQVTDEQRQALEKAGQLELYTSAGMEEDKKRGNNVAV